MDDSLMNMNKTLGALTSLLVSLLFPTLALAADGNMPTLGGIRLEFTLFAATLLGVALLYHYTCGSPWPD